MKKIDKISTTLFVRGTLRLVPEYVFILKKNRKKIDSAMPALVFQARANILKL